MFFTLAGDIVEDVASFAKAGVTAYLVLAHLVFSAEVLVLETFIGVCNNNCGNRRTSCCSHTRM